MRVEDIDNLDALRKIAVTLEMELRSAQAFMGMMILACGGKIEVPEEFAEALSDDFEISVTRDEKVATFTVVQGEDADALREGRDTVIVNV